MIENAVQYQVTREAAERFRDSLRLLDQEIRLDGVATRLRQAERDAIWSQLTDLEFDLAEYEAAGAAR
jgi:hypothetical protein